MTIFNPARALPFFALYVIGLCPILAATYYVDRTATGAGTGLTRTDAWTSLSAINQSLLAGGDVVLVYPGTYDEQLILTKSGTSPSLRITYRGVNKPIVRGINGDTASYIAILGFEFTQPTTAYTYSALVLPSTNYWLIENNYIHDTNKGGVEMAFSTTGSHNIIRANRFSNIGGTSGGGPGGRTVVQLHGDYNLCEYNQIDSSLDRFAIVAGIGNVIRNNYYSGTDTSLYPNSGLSSGAYPYHTDGVQPLSGTNQLLYERNWDMDNRDTIGGLTNSPNGHGAILQINTGSSDHAILRFNTMIREAESAVLFRAFNSVYVYNNTAIRIGIDHTSVFNAAVTWQTPIADVCDIRNNTFDYMPNMLNPGGIVSSANNPTNLTNGTQHSYNTGTQGTLMSGASPANLAHVDPLFVNGTGVLGRDNYTLQSTSPLRGAGSNFAHAVGAGANSTSLTVTAPKGFCDGWTAAPDGDLIKIGGAGSYVRISAINYTTGVITLASGQTWADGDPVIVKGMEDIGAEPYTYATTPSIVSTTSSTLATTGTVNLTATVGDTNSVRCVEFLVDGIPAGIAYDPSSGTTYSTTWPADGNATHAVEARAYNMWASQTLWVSDFNTSPRFTQQPTPVNPTVAPGGNVSFTVTATSGDGSSLSYQWQKSESGVWTNLVDGGVLSGSTTSSLTLTGVSTSDAGTYRVRATNAVDTEFSATTTLVIAQPPSITTQPLSQTVTYDATVTFTAAATGTPTPTVQWEKNGVSLTDGTRITGSQTNTLQITQTKLSDAGNYTFVASNTYGSNTYTATSNIGTLAVNKKNVVVSAIGVNSKPYDGTANATLTGSATLSGVASGDTVVVDETGATATFADSSVATNKTVTVTGLAITGADVANYTLTSSTATALANITIISLPPVFTANNKTYDATTSATIATRSLSGVIATDVGNVTLAGGTAAFTDAAVGSGKTVNASGFILTLTGGAAGNYQLSPTTANTTASIAKKDLTIVGITTPTKVYDATATAPISGTFALPAAEPPGGGNATDGTPYTGDVLTLSGSLVGAFADANAGTAKAITLSGLTLGGSSVGNYNLTLPTTFTANITSKPLNVTGVIAASRVYDATIAATVSGTAALLGPEVPGTGSSSDGAPYTGDVLSLSGTASGTFATAAAGTGKSVNIAGLLLGGTSAGNYTLAPTTTATITPAPLTVTGVVAKNKTYNGNVAASFDVSAASLSALVSGEPGTVTVSGVTGTFDNANVGTGKAVTVTSVSLGGTSGSNYIVTPPSGLIANITPANLTITGLTANNKVFDGTDAATFSFGGASLVGLAAADVGSVSIGAVTGTFVDSGIGNSKSVNVAAINLTGPPASNYTITLPVGLTADITSPTSIPSILTGPLNRTVVAGQSTTFTATADGYPAPTFQWQKNGLNIADATSSSYTISPVTANEAGSYTVVATNSEGTVTSDPAVLTVHFKPVITSPPADKVVVAHADATFTVAVNAVPNATYQWRFNGTPISGATSATLTLTNVTRSNGGSYDVVVTNSVGSTTSTAALLTVSPASYAGTYFGTFSGGGMWALYIRNDNTGTLIAYLSDRGSGLVLSLSVAQDGTFTVTGSELVGANGRTEATSRSPRAAATQSITLSGTIADGQVIGQAQGINQSLTGAPDSGSQTLDGFYTAPAVGATNGTTYSIVGKSGRALFVTITTARVDAASGAVNSDGTLNGITLAGVQLSVVINPVQQSLIAIYGTGTSSTRFVGLRDGVSSTTRLINLSARSNASVESGTFIAGFVIAGTGTKSLLIRGIGPTLGTLGVTTYLADPILTLYSGRSMLATNDDWSIGNHPADIASATTKVGAFALDTNSHDAALLVTPDVGSYTVHLTMKAGGTGLTLVEVYDINKSPEARLVNVSGRGLVGTGDNVLIAGFVIDGNAPVRLLIRGIGPGLTPFGVVGVLADPQIAIYRQGVSTPMLLNDDWGGSPLLKTTFGNVGAFSLADDSKDAALLVTLEPGAYTTVVSGVNQTTGVAIAEVYTITQ